MSIPQNVEDFKTPCYHDPEAVKIVLDKTANMDDRGDAIGGAFCWGCAQFDGERADEIQDEFFAGKEPELDPREIAWLLWLSKQPE
jgi:hypothetical protein